MARNKKNKEKSKYPILNALLKILIVLAVLPFCVLGCLFVVEHTPVTKTQFDSYSDFKDAIFTDYFFEELPGSASNVSYYYCKDFWFYKQAYSCILSDEDYITAKSDRIFSLAEQFKNVGGIYDSYIASLDEETKKDREYMKSLEKKNKDIITDSYVKSEADTLYLNEVPIYDEYLDKVITKVIHDKEDVASYHCLTYYVFEYPNAKQICGAAANDKNNELIEFQVYEKINTR